MLSTIGILQHSLIDVEKDAVGYPRDADRIRREAKYRGIFFFRGVQRCVCAACGR